MSDTETPGSDTVLVVPCYNESRRLDTTAVLEFLESSPRCRILFVNDRSTDDTAGVLSALCERSPRRLRWMGLEHNSGKAEAVRRGVLAAIAENPAFVGYWDADFSTPLAAVPAFLAVLDPAPDLLGVLGSRIRRLGAHVDRQPARHYAGRVFATLASLTLNISVYDTQCGAKMFRVTEEVARAFAAPFIGPWVFDVEILARLRQSMPAGTLEDRLFELPLARWQDVAGSKLTMSHRVTAVLDLLRIYRRYG